MKIFQILNIQSGWIGFPGMFFCTLNKISVWEMFHYFMLKPIKFFAIHFHLHLIPHSLKLDWFQLKSFSSWDLIYVSFQTCWPDSLCYVITFSSFCSLYLLNSNHFFFEMQLLSLQQYLGLDSFYLTHNYSLWIKVLILGWILFSLALYSHIFFQGSLMLVVCTSAWRNVLCQVFLIHPKIPIAMFIKIIWGITYFCDLKISCLCINVI